jgi:predicted secreted protein
MENTVRLRTGEEHTFTLQGWAAAGYAWTHHLEGASGVVALSTTRLGRPSTGSADAPRTNFSATDVVTIQALRPGQATVRSVLRRPWDADLPPRDEHVLTVTVEP